MVSQTIASTISLPFRFSFGHLTLKRLILAILFFGIIPFLGFYLFQTAELVRAIWLEKLYIQELTKLSEANIILQQKISNGLGLSKIEQEIDNLGFVEVSEIRYIPISLEYLAKE